MLYGVQCGPSLLFCSVTSPNSVQGISRLTEHIHDIYFNEYLKSNVCLSKYLTNFIESTGQRCISDIFITGDKGVSFHLNLPIV